MKAIVNRQALVEVLALACSVVPTRSPKPVLSCVRISTVANGRDKAIRLVSTDLEMTLETTIPQVEIGQEGNVLLPAGKLSEIVNNSPDETITLDTEGEKATIKGSDSTFTLLGFNPDEFPPVGGFEGDPDFSITAGALKDMLDRTRFAAAKEMSRYAINGVLFERKGKKLSLVATDGHRLSQTRDEAHGGESKDVSAVVPIKALVLLERLLTVRESTVDLQFRENKIFGRILPALVAAEGDKAKPVTQPTATFSALLVEGAFPPYQDVIPKACDRKTSLNRDKLQSAVRRAALLTNDDSRSVRLNFDSKVLTISGRSPDVGEAKVEMAIEFSGESLDVGFNPQYLLDALKVATTEEVTLELKSAAKPGLLRAGPNFLYVIMPVNLS